jgi:hypothetical protein
VVKDLEFRERKLRNRAGMFVVWRRRDIQEVEVELALKWVSGKKHVRSAASTYAHAHSLHLDTERYQSLLPNIHDPPSSDRSSRRNARLHHRSEKGAKETKLSSSL